MFAGTAGRASAAKNAENFLAAFNALITAGRMAWMENFSAHRTWTKPDLAARNTLYRRVHAEVWDGSHPLELGGTAGIACGSIGGSSGEVQCVENARTSHLQKICLRRKGQLEADHIELQ